MRRCIILLLLLITLVTACNGPGVNAYYRGNQAYEHGAYQVAFANYLYAAHEGVVPAQYALGYQYYYGQGTALDESKGITWLQRAAPHSARAQYALHLIQQNKPIQPWLYQLIQKHPTLKKPNHIYTKNNACKITVLCDPNKE